MRHIFWIAALTIPAGASCQPLHTPATRNIVVFGDSLSAAYGIPREAGWVNLLQQELQRNHPLYRLINASISGETAAGGRQRISTVLRQHQPYLVIIELGANDGLRGANTHDIETNLGDIIAQARNGRAKVLLAGMKLPPNYGQPYTTQFHDLYPRLAKKYRIGIVPFLLEGIAAEQFQADNLHPTAPAQPRILHNVMRELAPLL